MTSLFLAAHNDDDALFGAFLILRHRPHVATVFKSVKQRQYGITAEQREHETYHALQVLGAAGWEQWPFPDTLPDESVPEMIRPLMKAQLGLYDHVFAPAPEEGGHEQHNAVGEIALEVFGADNVTLYLTYRRGHGKTESEHEVPFEPEWPALKLAALSCYRSQISLPDTAPWFIDQTLREYLAHAPHELTVAKTLDTFLHDHADQIAVELALRERL